jgi:AAA domain-containing protein/DnaB helicase-like protein
MAILDDGRRLQLMNDERKPPEDITSELSVLGSIILDSGQEATAEVVAILSVEDFFRQDNRIIYQALLNLYNQVGVIDLVLLKSELERMGKLKEIGNVEYLVRLTESVPSTANAKYYAENVRNMALRRAYISTGTQLVNQAYDVTIEMDDLYNQADEINRIAEQVAPDVICLDDVETQQVHWLWFNRFPLGKLSVIAGDPGLGKSFLTLSMAAYVSAGIPWPDMPNESNPSGGVILMSAEDDIDDTIKPRLEAMSADCQNITFPTKVENLSTDIVKLERAIKQTEGVRLVVIDPISAYIGTKIDGHSNTEIRSILKPLKELAARYGIAILCVTHLNKGGPNNPIYRVMGSLAWTAAARTVWTIVKEKNEQPDPLCKVERRLLLPVKNNLACDTGTGMAFFIQDGAVVWEPKPIQTTAQDYFAEQDTGRPGPKPAAREEAERWILDTLSSGPMWASDIKEKAEQDGIPWITVKRAKREAGVLSEQHRAENKSRWYWRTEEQEGPPSDENS